MTRSSWGAGRFALVAVAVLLVNGAARASPIELITNGGFEAGGGSFLGWTLNNQVGSPGNWFIQSGIGSTLNNFLVPPPPGPTHVAMTDQFGPASHVLIQDFTVPNLVGSATLSFERFIDNHAGSFQSRNNFDAFGPFANQQARVDILADNPGNDFSVSPADVLLNVFQTNPGDPLVSGYTPQSTDLTAFLQAHEGQTLRLRFAQTANQWYFNFGVDQASLLVETHTPEPTSLAVFGFAAVGGLFYSWRRTRLPKA